jgi:hypothetical protein
MKTWAGGGFSGNEGFHRKMRICRGASIGSVAIAVRAIFDEEGFLNTAGEELIYGSEHEFSNYPYGTCNDSFRMR